LEDAVIAEEGVSGERAPVRKRRTWMPLLPSEPVHVLEWAPAQGLVGEAQAAQSEGDEVLLPMAVAYQSYPDDILPRLQVGGLIVISVSSVCGWEPTMDFVLLPESDAFAHPRPWERTVPYYMSAGPLLMSGGSSSIEIVGRAAFLEDGLARPPPSGPPQIAVEEEEEPPPIPAPPAPSLQEEGQPEAAVPPTVEEEETPEAPPHPAVEEEEERDMSIIPFDGQDLHHLFAESWTAPRYRKPGEPADQLFDMFVRSIANPRFDVPGLLAATLTLLRESKPADLKDCFWYFMSVHRFWVLIERHGAFHGFGSEVRQLALELVNFLTCELSCATVNDFRTIAERPRGREWTWAIVRILLFKEMMNNALGIFVWNLWLKNIDRRLGNDLVELVKYTKISQIDLAIENLIALSNFGVGFPVFLQALAMIRDYKATIQNGVPFERKAPDVPPRFLTAIIIMGKRKGVVDIMISDERLLAWADGRNVELMDLEHAFLPVEEPITDLPMSF
jgi:hypothetical protein